ncbi:GntR family transcriptional regulator [[Clostridium] symbiosum]|uniref:GntR family transcriptional regulator n=1 Tax=Clostridium symbiosum TaxID=1512 RepID=UPI001D083DCF|nr:GntR family transcriptional regulator [[Clostridium] symbiosum]MCB6608268.1 GntR family transcriptional regulator [[Clostridium] symbiosum]MCB6932818.1 GntR family transcriptional regulator [[Clostridium] symbiosum]
MTERKETPVYGKIVDDVRRRIESGQWREGQKLPGERELCNLYGVARGTLKAAFSELQKAGLIRQVRGSGTYVESREKGVEDLEKQADDLVSFLASLKLGEDEILTLGKTFILQKSTIETKDGK